jgi:molybdate transport system substrate-binding protein
VKTPPSSMGPKWWRTARGLTDIINGNGSSVVYSAFTMENSDKFFARLKSKTILVPGDQSAEVVVKGEAEIGVAQTSEIIPVVGAQLVGPLPGDLNLVTVFSAGLGAGSKVPDAATSYVKFITGPSAAAVLKTRGMEPK